MTSLFLKEADELFTLYPQLAARVTNLRSILQNVESSPISRRDAEAWVEDVKSVIGDFMTLNDKTALLIHHFLAEEKP